MSYQDKTCVCTECSSEFLYTARLQEILRKRDADAPVECPKCHGDRLAASKTKAAAKKEAILTGHKTDIDVSDKDIATPGSFGDFGFDPRLEKAIIESGYDTPTEVQASAIPVALAGQDIIGTAQTGTGKTAAFVLPILQNILDHPSKKPCTRTIVLTPTRELAEQVGSAFKTLAKYTKIRTMTVYGGVGMNPQEDALRRGCQIIVACPGRLLDHIDRGNTDFRFVDRLVLDEADRMLDMGFLPSIKRIISCMPAQRQTMLFSATFAPELTDLAANALIDPARIDIGLRAPAQTIAHALYPCPQHLKTSMLLSLLEKIESNSVLIFTRTKHRANRLSEHIEKAGYSVTELHSNKTQNQRQHALDGFRSGRCRILVATDIAARGLDVETISHVINYDIPDTADTYIHRIGRTGRAEREGDAITFITREDRGIVWDIENALGGPIERRELEGFDYNAAPPAFNAKPGTSAPTGTRPNPTKPKAIITSPPKQRSETPNWEPRKQKKSFVKSQVMKARQER